MNVGIICACLPSLKTIAKHHYPGSFNDELVFSTGDPVPQQQSVQWPSTFPTQDSGQPGSGSSVQLTSLSTNVSMNTDDYGKDLILSSTLTIEPLSAPRKAVVADRNLPVGVP